VKSKPTDIPKHGQWYEWYPCETHRVAHKRIIQQWEYDADFFPEHAEKCRESLGCCLFPYHGGKLSRWFLGTFGLATVRKPPTTGRVLDFLYQRVDFLMRTGQLGELDALVRRSNVEEDDIDYQLGILTATLPVRSKLPSRPAYFKLVKSHYEAHNKSVEPTLFQGLE
jgi:hypothetical protein